MDVNDFDYELPDALIAQTPLQQRTASKMLTMNKKTGQLSHQLFEDLIHHLEPGDLLIGNDSRVIPARLIGSKKDTKAKVEILLLHQVSHDCWEALVRPAKRLKVGSIIEFGMLNEHSLPMLSAVILEEKAMGLRVLKFDYTGIFLEILELLGTMPLPPYIRERLTDQERYQTVFSKHPGSVAAPTAGLHFNEAYLDLLRNKGIQIAFVTLHVGLGTFRPVSVERIEDHDMHAEYYEVSAEVIHLIQSTRAMGKRVIAIGTTAARTLETIAFEIKGDKDNSVSDPLNSQNIHGWTRIFIYPGYQFQVVDAIITNFHLPRSTLLMMLSALAGREHLLDAYQEAVSHNYRFFSFGDAMFIY